MRVLSLTVCLTAICVARCNSSEDRPAPDAVDSAKGGGNTQSSTADDASSRSNEQRQPAANDVDTASKPAVSSDETTSAENGDPPFQGSTSAPAPMDSASGRDTYRVLPPGKR